MKKAFRSYIDARDFARSLEFPMRKYWREYVKSGKKPNDIPSDPSKHYDEWISWTDFLGNDSKFRNNKNFKKFDDAREYVHGLQINNLKAWEKYAKSGNKPNDIPSDPRQHYDEFVSYGDWLGSGAVANTKKVYKKFDLARKYVHKLKLKSKNEWLSFKNKKEFPKFLPKAPEQYYKEWVSYPDWLGSGFIKYEDRKYRSFEDALKYIRSLNLKSAKDWRKIKKDQLPDDIPRSPEKVYPEWISIGHWIGHHNRWYKKNILLFLKSLLPVIDKLDPSQLYAILINNKILDTYSGLNDPITKKALKATLSGNKKEAEKIFSKINYDELEDVDYEEPHLIEEDEFNVIKKDFIDDTETDLPNIKINEMLDSIDYLESAGCISDSETADFLMSKAIGKIWNNVLDTSVSEQSIIDLKKKCNGHYSTYILEKFYDEYKSILDLEIPKDYSFTIRGELVQPNLMQRLIAYKTITNRKVGNWSGTGSGKTLGAILASELIKSKLTLVIGLNNTILDDDSGWSLEIKKSFPNSYIHRKIKRNFQFKENYSNYLLLNYESFQLSSSKKLVDDIINNYFVDMIILDEIHFIKSNDRSLTKRRKILNYLIQKSRDKNPKIAILGMSATPVVNSLSEGISLIETITGKDYSDLDSSPKLSNALVVHQHLTINGIRYKPRYNLVLNEKTIKKTDNSLVTEIKENNNGILPLETILLNSKLELIAPLLKPGTIIFSLYVTEIFPILKKYIESCGYTTGQFSGEDKTGLNKFKDGSVDILISSSSLGTGVDGLQLVSNRLIIITLPWTSAAYEQLIGRIFRQGSRFKSIDVFIPQILIKDDVNHWSWDEQRYARIKYKKTLSDTAVDGIIPEGNLISPQEMIKDARNELMSWIDRLNNNNLMINNRQKLVLPLPADEIDNAIGKFGDFSIMNARINSSLSSTNFTRFKKDPSEWYLYHTLYSEARKTWDEIPYEIIAESLKSRPDLIIGDFGCGEAKLSQLIKNKVWNFDFVAVNDSVMECDMTSIDLEDNTIDVAVFSLSLMGKNWAESLSEAYRLIKPGGLLKIAEPKNKWNEEKLNILKTTLRSIGFSIHDQEILSSRFVYINATKPL